jgi:2-polyprenyl-6-methoxyphenol hydroxylase-like FAD-dependent oxidoreductase
MYDVIVIGARCAGAPTALLLARRGYRVLLLDKATFPSDCLNNYYIHQPGIACLQRWGLLNQVVASGCPPIRQITLATETATLKGSPPPVEGIAAAYAPRRRVLDTLLVEAAVAAGVEVRQRFVVQELLQAEGQVVGIRGRTAGGPIVTERARLTVGADGLHSLVARAVQAPRYGERPALSCVYYTHWSGLPVEGLELYLPPRRAIVMLPTHEELTLVAISWPVKEFHQVRTDIAGHYFQALALIPGLVDRVRSGQRAERFRGTAELPNFFRHPYGPGWALVGDAGYHKDPGTAQGITDAFRDAELLSAALDAGLTGRCPLMEAFAGYERQRNAAVQPMYEFTCQLAALEPPSSETLQLYAALGGQQAAIDCFLGTIAGTVPIGEFFAPEHLRLIFEAANG